MSFLPPDLLPGDPSVVGMLISAGPTQPFFAPASGGGGGGGGGPNPSVSTLSFAQGGQINMSTLLRIQDQANGESFDFSVGASLSTFAPVADQPCSAFLALSPNGVGSLAMASANDGTGWLTTYYNGVPVSTLNVVADNVYMSSLTVSSINGASPGGANLFQSTFNAVPCPGNTSTILCELPAGQFAYQGLISGGGATSMLSGNVNVIITTAGPDNWGQISQAPSGQPPNSFPAQMVINEGDSILSTIKLIVSATGATSGAFTGVVQKLY